MTQKTKTKPFSSIVKQIINLEFLSSKIPEMLFYLYLCDFSPSSSGKIIFQAAAILNCLIWRHHWELALAPGRFGQSISKITSEPIFMLLYKFAHSLMRIPLTIDLSAAFDTIDRDILITRLSSWFGIHGSVLSWFKSYLSSRYFRVKCETDLSSWHTSSCGVPQLPQGSVLGPLLFVMYTTPLSTLISSCSLNHHLYADDTQPFLSFLPTHFDSSIDHLHDTLDRISSWMTANLLTLNSSKTEFLLIGLSK